MKKIVILGGLLFLLFPFNIKAMENYYDIDISNEEYSRLINLGFTDSEIKSMPKEIYEKNKDLIGNVVAETTKYYKNTYYYPYKNINMLKLNEDMEPLVVSEEISKEEFESSKNDISLMESDSVTQDTRSLTTSIVKVGNYYRVKNYVSWGKIPNTKSKDINGIQINHSIVEPKSGSENAFTSFEYRDNCRGVSKGGRSTVDREYSKGPNGYGVIQTLPAAFVSETITNTYGNWPCGNNVPDPGLGKSWKVNHPLSVLNHTFYYDLIKLQQNPISAYGNYKHARSTSNTITTADFSIGTGGVSFTISISSNYSNRYDNFQGTHAQLMNPNW